MSLFEFSALVFQMRSKQKAFFVSKAPGVRWQLLKESRELEKQVDETLREIAEWQSAEETCCCGILMDDHHAGGSCTSPKSMADYRREKETESKNASFA